jgi:hypothetical protein
MSAASRGTTLDRASSLALIRGWVLFGPAGDLFGSAGSRGTARVGELVGDGDGRPLLDCASGEPHVAELAQPFGEHRVADAFDGAGEGAELDAAVLALLFGLAFGAGRRARPLDLLHERGRGEDARELVRPEGWRLIAAIVDNTLYTLPKLGRFAWENSLVQPNHGTQTVIMSMEDGPAALDPAVENSQVYMYVGKKDHRAGAGVLRRNGLDRRRALRAGALRLVEVERGRLRERQRRRGLGRDPDADELEEAQLEAASDAVGAIRFGRPEAVRSTTKTVTSSSS